MLSFHWGIQTMMTSILQFFFEFSLVSEDYVENSIVRKPKC